MGMSKFVICYASAIVTAAMFLIILLQDGALLNLILLAALIPSSLIAFGTLEEILAEER